MINRPPLAWTARRKRRRGEERGALRVDERLSRAPRHLVASQVSRVPTTATAKGRLTPSQVQGGPKARDFMRGEGGTSSENSDSDDDDTRRGIAQARRRARATRVGVLASKSLFDALTGARKAGRSSPSPDPSWRGVQQATRRRRACWTPASASADRSALVKQRQEGDLMCWYTRDKAYGELNVVYNDSYFTNRGRPRQAPGRSRVEVRGARRRARQAGT